MQMNISVILAIAIGAMVFFVNPVSFLASAPLLLAWLLSPLVALRSSRQIVVETETIFDEQRKRLRRLARLTWLFFERFVGPEDHWLPPDNFQEQPRGLIAHRTSPTNIGLLLVSTFAAYDFGYLDLPNLISRLQLTLESLDKLERYRGHFLNWYDTRNLESLPPRYVSTVDSGNLAACFLVAIPACRELPAKPVMRWERWRGLLDLLDLILERTGQLENEVSVAASQTVSSHLETMRSGIIALKDDPSAWGELIIDLYFRELDELDRRLRSLIEAHGQQFGTGELRSLRLLTSRLYHHLQSANRELALLLPWLKRFIAPPGLFANSSLDEELAAAWSQLLEALPADLNPEQIIEASQLGEEQLETLQTHLASLDPSSYSSQQLSEAEEWCRQLREELQSARIQVRALLTGNQVVIDWLHTFLQECDFGFLFDQHRQIFHIGYNVDAAKLDPNYYDLLASESRIASMVAIANGDVPIEHWLHLGRPLTQVDGKRALLSWSASMFEYLMPDLFMRTYPDTLLHQSGLVAVERQIAYGSEKRVPWGISEAGYYSFDVNMNYQYRSFGAPGLGFKRGLEDDLVISPYASLLALSLRSQTVIENVRRMEELGMLGTYGFYESIDFTSSHLPLGQDHAIVRSYMAHHQGMIMMSLANFLKDKNMVGRFHANRRIQSIELLLQELVPRSAPLEQIEDEEVQTIRPVEAQITAEPWEVPVQAAVPQLHVISNGRFTTFLSSVGSGYCSWQGVALTRWRQDTTLDSFGIWIYVKDLDRQRIWSAGYQPTAEQPQIYSAHFFPHKAEIHRRDDGISLSMEVTVPADEDAEVRIITLTNHDDSPRSLRITSFGEVVLNELAVDRRHPAFNKLFIESEFIPELNALLFRRRLRSSQEEPVFMIHALLEEDSKMGFSPELDYETNRANLLGRGGSVRFPAALCESEDGLAGTTGATLDPVMSLSRQFSLEPHQSVRFALITLAARSREDALALASRFQEWDYVVNTPDKARSRAEAEMREMGLTLRELKNIQQLQAVLFYPQKALRAVPEILSANQRGQQGLWGYEISGDYPILLLEIADENHLDLLAELLRAHIYWRRRGLRIDLVILNQLEIGYTENLSSQVYRLIERMRSGDWLKRRGGIFILREKQMNMDDVVLLKTAARAVHGGDRGSLEQQLGGLFTAPTSLPSFVPSLSREDVPEYTPALTKPDDLIFENGFGGFTPDGREYVIYLTDDRWTPAPWVNVISNENFGFLVSESGSGFTWNLNSGENRLTPWKNDPVSDPPGETIYLRDEETGYVWSPTPLPVRESAPYLVRHGAGYSSFQHNSHGLRQSLLFFTVRDEPVKIVQLTLENTWDRVRRITATYYAEWVLGSDRDSSQLFIIPEFDSQAQAILARNSYNQEFGDQVAFLASDRDIHGLTTDRSEFLGRNGSYAQPAALNRIGLSGSIQPGSDPCAALQVHLDLEPGEKAQVHFLIGQVADPSEVQRVVERYSKPEAVEAALNSAIGFWEDLLGTLQVETPDPAMNLMLNRWLLYQALSCRIWGRSAFYQSSGAFGYRDQLQDVMSMLYAAPHFAREHILKAAAHQFEEGDVLHWWNPPSGRGVRTRITDDLVWLPFVTAHYVSVTGDESILDEEIPFRRAPLLGANEEERYGLFPLTEHAYPIYEHCLRALERGTTTGPHSLPLIGAGDWNDGMNRVGIEGHGESVWLGWFLRTTLLRFAELCDKREDPERASLFKRQAAEYEQALQDHAWDGSWYLRAYYDDGWPLGSSVNRECQLDSIAQSWAVLSGSNDKERIQIAMDSVLDRLVREDDNLLLLFTPPFDKTPRDPGYIKGYPPGIRENGGQYTHAAIWTVWAYTLMGQADRAEMLFRMLNPVYHSDSEQKALTYKVEPYVIAADIYGAPPHTGRGGWTWYTGSSGWFYRLGIEAILGLRLRPGYLEVDPCIPANWPDFKLSYRHGRTTYNIIVNNPSKINRGVSRVELDGNLLLGRLVPLIDDGAIHTVQVVMEDGG
jgi:cyclic beta-1,2-glucan synthetase